MNTEHYLFYIRYFTYQKQVILYSKHSHLYELVINKFWLMARKANKNR